MDNYIRKILQIKNERIKINEQIEEIKIKRIKTLIYYGKLTEEVNQCPCCKVKKQVSNIVKNGSREIIVRLSKISNLAVNLKLKKQRYKCRVCNNSFIIKTNLIDKNKNISNPLKIEIYVRLGETTNVKQILKECKVSTSVVVRAQKELEKSLDKSTRLPDYLCFDEIKSTKDSKGKMSFIYCDAKTHKVIDIVEDRTYWTLKNTS